MKSIVRIVHLPSVVQSEFYDVMTILFVRNENKNNEKIISSLSLCVSVEPFWRLSTERKLRTLFCISRNTRMRYFRSNQSVNTRRKRILVLRLTQKSVRSLCSVDNLQKSHRGDKLFFYFLCVQKVFSLLYKMRFILSGP